METVTEFIKYLSDTWVALPIFIQAFLLTIIFVSAIVEAVKRSFLMSLSKSKRRAWIWRVSFLLGCVSGYVGSTFSINGFELWHWILIGGVSGSASNGLHWLSVKVAWPYIKTKFSKKVADV